MKRISLGLAALLATTAAGAANAASIGLSTNYSLDYMVAISTSEAGGMTYNWETNTLYVVGDEAVCGRYAASNGASSGDCGFSGLSSYQDTEGLAFLGGDGFAVTQERKMEINRLSTIWHTPEATAPTFDVNGPFAGNVGNIGLEGVSYDRRTGDFYGVKETGPQAVYFMTGVDFAGNGVVSELFNASLLGLETLSDISVLSNSDAFFGTAFGDNLLILSASSNLLLEVTKTGEILSSLDLAFTGVGKIEGVTVDDEGNIYLVGEEGPLAPGGYIQSGLIKLQRNVAAPAVPEPATWAMMLGGLGLVGGAMRRRKTSVAFA